MKKRDPNDSEIGKRVRSLRLQRRMTQTKLGALLDVTFQQVQKYENGANRISAGRLLCIADIFKMPVPFFFGESDDSKSPERSRGLNFDLFQSGDVIRLVRAYSQIKDQDIRLGLLRLARTIAADTGSK